jgi:hypothetical protein
MATRVDQPRFGTQNQEDLSFAYLAATAAAAGCYVEQRRRDVHGIDGEMFMYESSGSLPEQPLWFQLKSTSRWRQDDSHVTYDVPVAAYRRLRERRASVPAVLVVVLVPDDHAEWVDHSENRAEVRKCAYWVSLEGGEDTANRQSVAVAIPRRNALSPEEILRVMTSVTDDRFPDEA